LSDSAKPEVAFVPLSFAFNGLAAAVLARHKARIAEWSASIDRHNAQLVAGRHVSPRKRAPGVLIAAFRDGPPTSSEQEPAEAATVITDPAEVAAGWRAFQAAKAKAIEKRRADPRAATVPRGSEFDVVAEWRLAGWQSPSSPRGRLVALRSRGFSRARRAVVRVRAARRTRPRARSDPDPASSRPRPRLAGGSR
jgi:hypothetical protein